MKLLISTPIYSDLVMAIICWNLQLKVWMESFLRAKRQKLQSKSDDRYWLALPCINLKPFCYVWWGVCNFPPKKCPKHWQNFKWRRIWFFTWKCIACYQKSVHKKVTPHMYKIYRFLTSVQGQALFYKLPVSIHVRLHKQKLGAS